jgi:hypothetical protein
VSLQSGPTDENKYWASLPFKMESVHIVLTEAKAKALKKKRKLETIK